jgi:hypothetical protein
MPDFGKKISGLIGSENIDQLKKLGVDTVGDLLGKTLKNSDEKSDSSVSAPPTGNPVTDLHPPVSAKVENPTDEVPATKPNSPESHGHTKSAVDKIIDLNGLREKGLLTDSEFTALKNALLS